MPTRYGQKSNDMSSLIPKLVLVTKRLVVGKVGQKSNMHMHTCICSVVLAHVYSVVHTRVCMHACVYARMCVVNLLNKNQLFLQKKKSFYNKNVDLDALVCTETKFKVYIIIFVFFINLYFYRILNKHSYLTFLMPYKHKTKIFLFLMPSSFHC